jgi:hypothetical protein
MPSSELSRRARERERVRLAKEYLAKRLKLGSTPQEMWKTTEKALQEKVEGS